MDMPPPEPQGADALVTLCLCGDVMTGRGVDQILPHPCPPRLHETYVRSALDYVALAERATGPIPRPVDFDYPWGDVLAVLDRVRPDAWLVNLETAVTASEDAWPDKGIHYRMHPANLPCLAAARIDACALANNHVLDWGRRGLADTLDSLHRAGIRTAGAGQDLDEAAAPAIVELAGKSRVLVFACATRDCGVPEGWAATHKRSGIHLLEDLSPRSVDAIARRVGQAKQAHDLAVLSIHWGGNWGFAVSREERSFAHQLIDRAGVDVVHGHSSHHVRGVEVYRERPILYGCGDLLTDYEGIGRHEAYRPELSLLYLPVLDARSGRLQRFSLVPTQVRHMRIHRAPPRAAAWLRDTLNREGQPLGTQVRRASHGDFVLSWHPADAGEGQAPEGSVRA